MSILDSAELLLQAKNYSGSGDWLDESGNGHDAQFGTGTPGTNDPLFKPFVGTQYIYVPVVNGNGTSAPDSNELSITGDIELIGRIQTDAWPPAGTGTIVSKMNSNGTDGYRFQLASGAGGTTRLFYSWGDGTTYSGQKISSLFSPSGIIWTRVTHDVDDGASDDLVSFYWSADQTLDPDLVSWTAIGTVTNGAATSIGVDNAISLGMGSWWGGDTDPLGGDLYHIQVLDGIGGTLQMDMVTADATSPFATFTERSSNAATITISYATSGRRTAVIDRAQMLYTTDDYHEIADVAALDFGNTDDFSGIVVFRTNTVASGEDVLLAKKDDLTTSLGYALLRSTAAGKFVIADGTLDDDDTAGTIAVHTLASVAGVRDAAGDDDLEAFKDGTGSGSPTTDSTTTTLANAFPVRIGATSNTAASFFEGSIMAVALWPAALTGTEVLEAHLNLTALPAFPPFARRQNRLIRM